MRWLVTGAQGMLGQDLVRMLRDRGEAVTAVSREQLDVLDQDEVAAAVPGHDVVVNCAAWTAVDAAEESEPDAFGVNAVGAANLARVSRETGARMVQISTDYVFDGHAGSPYAETAVPAPRSAYGRTKLAGEWAVRAETDDYLIVRTAWLYGAGGGCFPKTITRVARERGHVDVVDDQVGQPTWTVDLADLVIRLVEAQAPSGVYHGTSGGACSWFQFARAAVSAAGMADDVVAPTTSEGFVRPAPRPAYSVLGHDALRAVGVEPIGDWSGRWDEAAATVLA